MNWDAMGAIGNILGALAVVISLGYVAVQIRQNTKALHHASLRAAIDDAADWRNNLIQDREVARLYRTGMLKSEDLDEIDLLRFRMLLDSLFAAWEYAYSSKSGLADVQVRFIRGTLNTPGGALYWVKQKAIFGADFASYVDSLDSA